MYPLGRLGSWEGFWKLSRVHATKVVFVLCFGGLGPGGCAAAFEITCKDQIFRGSLLALLLSVH